MRSTARHREAVTDSGRVTEVYPEAAELGQFCAESLAENVDRNLRAIVFVVPEGPAIAGIQPLHMRCNAMNGAGGIGTDERAVGTNFCAMALCRSGKNRSGRQQSAFYHPPERDT